ncbi:MAG: hypothetical protein QM780_02765 [Hyphomicrobium sp.]|uniref:hypothetical protein n=1 Tax=Hyphomicrobium sp. TaxID=82 RepID=UPI0039E68BD1
MLKRLAVLTAAFVVAGSAYALADEWAEKFTLIDADGSGTVGRAEWDANWQKLKLDPAPEFTAIDTDNNNSIDKDEWAAAQKVTQNYSVSCKSSTESWCPKK